MNNATAIIRESGFWKVLFNPSYNAACICTRPFTVTVQDSFPAERSLDQKEFRHWASVSKIMNGQATEIFYVARRLKDQVVEWRTYRNEINNNEEWQVAAKDTLNLNLGEGAKPVDQFSVIEPRARRIIERQLDLQAG